MISYDLTAVLILLHSADSLHGRLRMEECSEFPWLDETFASGCNYSVPGESFLLICNLGVGITNPVSHIIG